MYNIVYYGYDGVVRCLGDGTLSHYNHNHDKLGRFAPSNGSARAYAKSLNRLDNEHVKLRGQEMRTAYKATKTATKASKAKNADKKKKLQAKSGEQMKTVKDLQKQQKDIEKFMGKTIKEANSKGYTVKSKQGLESSQRGRDYINWSLAGNIGTAMTGIPAVGFASAIIADQARRGSQERRYASNYNGATPSRIQGNKFKVKSTKEGEKPSTQYIGKYEYAPGFGKEKVVNKNLYGNEKLPSDSVPYERKKRKK